jgi:hypothetical protein
MAAGRKDQESDGWASRFDAPYSVAFTLQIDFWKQRKKPGQMCTKMPFLILIVLDAFQYLRGYLMLLLPLISVKLVGGFFSLTEPSDSGPTTPLPNKKLLLFVLDRLQK